MSRTFSSVPSLGPRARASFRLRGLTDAAHAEDLGRESLENLGLLVGAELLLNDGKEEVSDLELRGGGALRRRQRTRPRASTNTPCPSISDAEAKTGRRRPSGGAQSRSRRSCTAPPTKLSANSDRLTRQLLPEHCPGRSRRERKSRGERRKPEASTTAHPIAMRR